MRLLVISVAAGALLSGCVHNRAQSNNQSARDQAMVEVNASCMAAYQDPAAQILRSKIPLKSSDATFPQLTDQSKADSAEQNALTVLENAMTSCANKQEDFVSKFGAPGAYAAYMDFAQQTKALRASLWAREISFGEFNTRRASIESTFRGKMATAEAAAPPAPARAAPAAAPVYIPPPVVIPPVQFTPMQTRQPTQTNCYRVGNNVNCTTY